MEQGVPGYPRESQRRPAAEGCLGAWDDGVLPVGMGTFPYLNYSRVALHISALNTYEFCDCPVQYWAGFII